MKQERDKTGKTVRFRVASANSGRVLAEVFKDDRAWCSSGSDSVDSNSNSSPEAEQSSSLHTSEANPHLNGLAAGEATVDENGCEPDDLLLYASVKREMVFCNKRINICSKNGTIRGVRNKVSAGQVLFNNLSNMYSVSTSTANDKPLSALSVRVKSIDQTNMQTFFFRVPTVIREGSHGRNSDDEKKKFR